MKKNILIVSSTVTYPISSGGHERVFHIANELGNSHNVKVYSPYVRKSERDGTNQVKQRENFLEYMHHTPLLQVLDFVLSKILYPRWIYSVFAKQLAKTDFFQELLNRSDIIIFSGPDLVYMSDGVQKPISYLSHNIEWGMVRDLGSTVGSSLRESLMKRYELDLCNRCANIYVCSDQDKEGYIEAGVKTAKISVLSNGNNGSERSKHDLEQPSAYVSEKRTKIVFLGSSHLPNQEGLDWIHDTALLYPEYVFVILGSVCQGRVDTHNIKHLGFVSAQEKSQYLYYADRAINPIWSGGGSSLKVVDYMSHGLPLISTEFGMRGFASYTRYISIDTAHHIADLGKLQTDDMIADGVLISDQLRRKNLVNKIVIDAK